MTSACIPGSYRQYEPGRSRLGPVHRQIGVAKEVVARLGAELGHHDADAGADEHLGAGDRERVSQGVDEALGRGVRLGVGRQLLEQDAELVAAPPADRVAGTHAGGEARRDLLEEQVAGDVPEGVVDALEPVEVEVQHGERSSPTGRLLERVLEAVCEQRAVGEVRERVVEGLVRELVLERLALGDVACVEDDAGDVGVVEQARAEDLGVTPRAVAAADAQLGGDVRPLSVHRRVDERGEADMVVEVHEVEVGGVEEGADCRARGRDRSTGSGR